LRTKTVQVFTDGDWPNLNIPRNSLFPEHFQVLARFLQ